MQCKYCGQHLEGNPYFCDNCGQRMEYSEPEKSGNTACDQQVVAQNRAKKPKNRVWLILAVLVVLVAMVAVIFLMTSGKENNADESDSEDEQTTIIEKPSNPMEVMAYEDARELFNEENPDLTLKSIVTEKSMTEEKLYEITLVITAENQYALWTFEMELAYTQYDQGWMMEEHSVYSQGYEVLRHPEAEDMTEITQNCLRAIEEYMYVDVMQITECNYSEQSQQVVCTWIGQEEMLHAVVEREYLARFYYDGEADKWFITYEGNYSDSPEIEILSTTVNRKNVDFSGTWEARIYISPRGYGEIEISNYNGDELDLIFHNNYVLDPDNPSASGFESLTNGTKNDTLYHFTKYECHDEKSTACHTCYYCAEIDMYLMFTYSIDKTEIEFGGIYYSEYYTYECDGFGAIGISYNVTERLPELINH